MNEGFEIRRNYIERGLDTKTQRQQTLEKLKEELEQIEQVKDEKEQVKDDAERPEKDAIERHKSAWEEVKSQREAEREKERAATAFSELDKDQDGRVTFEEILFHPELDPDNTNEFTPEEAVSLLAEEPEVFQDKFAQFVWVKIKDKYSITPKTTETPEIPEPPAPPAPVDEPPKTEGAGDEVEDDLAIDEEEAAFEDDYDDYDEDDYDEPLEDEDLEDEEEEDDDDGDEDIRRYREMREKRKQKKDQKTDDDMPEYDSYTKTLIQIADDARAEYNEVNDKMKEIEKNISTLEKEMGVDLGMEHEFLPLQGECYEYSDREYTYKLCAFDKASQRSKSGGSETSLGKWGEWSGPADNKYSEMKYTGGLKCWNGPDRSCVVKLKCGKENQLMGASEPERCVYEFTMTTPALCNKKIDLTSGNMDGHDEL
ncbi:putative glucosidase 2 subunit beta [Apostichopus japonicus]|uniref:Putative glucosidase 2 subunit beta n=1 Tax=Stichopus japonicus TaxID=307972 RepID=A0A2G8KQ98_STIJA|nr:putative glucosidase 2 subunit beta [Apostichopus japonicus]